MTRIWPSLKVGASLDRFGLFNSTAGGQMVKIYLDDLKYTARRLNEPDKPLKILGRPEAKPTYGDVLVEELRWEKFIQKLRGKTLRLKFTLHEDAFSVLNSTPCD